MNFFSNILHLIRRHPIIFYRLFVVNLETSVVEDSYKDFIKFYLLIVEYQIYFFKET